jgi:hypothetical protein
MAVSASDIRSALSLPSSSTPVQSTTPAPRKSQGQVTKKPEGISRELYALIGPSAPSLVAHLAKPRLKQKPNFGSGGKVKWSVSCYAPVCMLINMAHVGNGDHLGMLDAPIHCSWDIGSKQLMIQMQVCTIGSMLQRY